MLRDCSRFTLPHGNDLYSALTIEHASSDQLMLDNDVIEESTSSWSPLSPCAPIKTFKRTFKGVANAIIAQRFWAKRAKQNWELELAGISKKYENRTFNTLTFNEKAFKSHIQACDKISPTMKGVLRNYSLFRTEEEVKLIGELVNRLKVFEKYSREIREELGRILYYDFFEDGRLITRQGQAGFSFYFIVSGKVTVERIEVDKSTGIRHVQRVDELGPGDSFGELTLLHSNTRRTASMISHGCTEFLRVDRGEFAEILKVCQEKALMQRADILGELIPFSSYSRATLLELNNHTIFRSYPPSTVILDNTKPKLERVYFIVSGTCNIIRDLVVIKRELSDKNHCKYILPSHEFMLKIKAGERPTMQQKDTVERHFLLLDSLKRGDAFSGDESLPDLFYICVGKAEVIEIPILQLAKNKKNYEEVKTRLTRFLPSREKTFISFMAEVEWNQYKRDLVEEVLAPKLRKQFRC